MPELPDIVIYIDALERRVLGRRLERIRIANPFLLRSTTPPIEALTGRTLTRLRRLGKRIVFTFDNDLSLVLHLMIAGRLHWVPTPAGQAAGAPIKKKLGLAAFDFEGGTLLLTEAGSTRRASLHVADETGVAAIDRGGIEVIGSTLEQFRDALTRENHTVKRALTAPALFSGIGNAYSDEILHRARLSPLTLTSRLTDEQIARLHAATQDTLNDWVTRLRAQTGEGFPEKVTAFRSDMAVHGRFGQPCPDCGSPVQRIVYAANECNYCARCQTGGRLLADRAMSRLLKDDRPKWLDEVE
jgi:formamidopyrimidine-DNA glycosylase